MANNIIIMVDSRHTFFPPPSCLLVANKEMEIIGDRTTKRRHDRIYAALRDTRPDHRPPTISKIIRRSHGYERKRNETRNRNEVVVVEVAAALTSSNAVVVAKKMVPKERKE
jgi:hypothetical protein